MIMKSIILTLALSFATICLFGQFRFGAGIDTNFGALGIAGKAQLSINDEWGGQIGFNWYLNDSNPSRLDFDATYLLTTAGDRDDITLKGLGGFNYWSSGVPGGNNELGINIGANISFPIEDKLFYLEPRITLISVRDFFIGAGMYF